MRQPGDTCTIVYQPNAYGGRLAYFGESATAEYWDSLWDELAGRENTYARSERGHLPHQLRRTFLKWVKPGARVLEAGCGLGQFTVALNALGYLADGVDFAPMVIERLKRRFPHIHFFHGDVRCLSTVADGTYDAVYSPGVCEHFEEGPEAVLRENHRILKTGGIVLVSTPYFNAYRRFLQRLGKFRNGPRGPFFQYAFTTREMRFILERIGFDVIEVHPYGVLKTVTDYTPLVSKIPLGPCSTPVAWGLDSTPLLRRWGHACIWVGRKAGQDDGGKYSAPSEQGRRNG